MKKGFTLIELILSISLIVLVGVTTTVLVINHNKNKEIKILQENSKKLENALNVYLDSHPEVLTNLEDNAKAAIVTLETLKDEGLISKNMDVNYKNEYFLLSNAKLLDSEDDTSNSVDCANNVVAIEIFKKWDLSSEDGSKVMYVCPKNNLNQNNNLTVGVDELEKRVKALEKQANLQINFYKGATANNYVRLDVNNTKYISFPNNNKNLWRIVSYYGVVDENDGSFGNVGNTKLVYNQSININFKKLSYTFPSKDWTSYHKTALTNNANTPELDLNKLKIYTVSCSNNNYALYTDDNSTFYIYKYTTGTNTVNLLDFISSTNDPLKYFEDNYFSCFSEFNESDKEKDSVLFSLQYPDIVGNLLLNQNNNYYIYSIGNNNYFYRNILKDMYNNMTNKGLIEYYPYYHTSSTSYANECITNYGNVNMSYIGNITYDEYIKTINNNNTSWLSYYKNIHSLFVSWVDDGMTYYSNVVCGSVSASNATVIPVVTLKTGVKIKKDTSCSNSMEAGSISCPYILDYVD